MKKLALILGASLLAILVICTLSFQRFYQSVQYFPVTQFQSTLDFLPNELIDESHEFPVITLPDYVDALQVQFPNIQGVSKDTLAQAILDEHIAILPWWELSPMHRILRFPGEDLAGVPKGIETHAWQFKRVPQFDPEAVTEILVGGTVVLARGVASRIEKENDALWPWRGTAPLFRDADYAVVNFKSPLVRDFEAPKSRWSLYGPSSYVSGLTHAGIDLVGISGNHMGDAGKAGLLDTMSILESAGIGHVGAGRDRREAYQSYVWTQDGHRYGFLAFNNVPGSIQKAAVNYEDGKGVGIAWIDTDAITAIQDTKAAVDTLIVLCNWGKEYIATPSARELNWAKKMVDAGADIILGDQAHWVQNYDFYRRDKDLAYVAYGLGNFIFDQHWSIPTEEGILERLIFYNGDLFQVQHIPVVLAHNNQVHPATGARKEKILKQLYGLYAPKKKD